MAATIREVARRAGVSVGTVSRVVNGHQDVTAELRARVEETMRACNYRPNLRAQSLARKSSGCLAFVISNRPVVQPFNAWVLNGVLDYCEQSGYLVVVERFQYSASAPLGTADVPRVLRSTGAVDGAILAGTNYPNLTQCLNKMGVPHVLLGNAYVTEPEPERFDQVRIDHACGGRLAMEYLIQLGHRAIWYIGDLSLPWYRDRYEAYLQAAAAVGLPPRAQVEGISDDRFLNGFHSAEMLIAQKQPFTAIIGSTNEVAYGIWEALDRAGLRVPEDVSLIGFDDERTTHKSRPLTCITADAEEEGRQLARMAIAKSRSPDTSFPEVVISPGFVKHGTCRPVLSVTGESQAASAAGD